MFKQRRKRGSIIRTFVFWLAFTLSLGMMGMAAAAWHDEIGIVGTVSTGFINPVFSGCGNGGDINRDGKTLSITMDDAEPGREYEFAYTVANKGSIPIRLVEDDDILAASGLNVSNDFPTDSIIAKGDSANGWVTISLPGAAGVAVEEGDGGLVEPETYRFDLNLTFRQWNLD